MFKPISAGIAALTGLAFILPAGSAAADDYDEKRVVEPGACVQASGWGVAGSRSFAIANDSVVWRSNRHLHVYYSWGKAELRTCDRGYLEDGGKIGLRHTWKVIGSNVGSCDFGWGGSCTVSDTKETSTIGMPWRSNTSGSTSYNMGVADIYAASNAGWLEDYYHSVYVRFISPSGNAETSTTATVHVINGGA